MAINVLFFFVLMFISANANMETKAINAVSSKCAEESGMPIEQLQAAIQDEDIKKISACFFKCYLSHFGVITKEGDKDIVNVPMTLVFVKYYIPEITLIDLLVVGAEVMDCSKDFEKSTLSDDHPGCLKTKMLVKCLAKREVLMNALWLAINTYNI